MINYTLEELAIIPQMCQDSWILYIEDAKGISIYDDLLKNVKKKYNLEIFSAKTKENVKKIFKLNMKKDYFYRTLHLVDQDYEAILEKQMIDSSNFFYLNKYTLENYFITEKYWNQILKYKLNCTEKHIQKNHNFKNWKENTEKQYTKIIPLFLMISKNCVKVKYSDCSFKRFLHEKKFEIEKDKIRSYLKEINEKSEDKNLSINEYKFWAKKIKKYPEILDLIPGKQLLNLLMTNINSIAPGCNLNKFSQNILGFQFIDSSFEIILKKIEIYLDNIPIKN